MRNPWKATAQHSTAQHSTAQHSTAQPSIAQHTHMLEADLQGGVGSIGSGKHVMCLAQLRLALHQLSTFAR